VTFLRPPLDSIHVTSPYGPRVLDGVSGFHDGIDLRAPIGTPIYAPHHGEVEHTSAAGACGQSVVLRLVSGIRVVFCHLSQALVSPGMSVAAGSVIGLTGNSGSSRAPHLHLSVKRIQRDGTLSPTFDPAPLLGGGPGAALLLLAAALAFA
jgi:murein DD-endopeptidase MepM/ murein hydrolase activator NlpD